MTDIKNTPTPKNDDRPLYKKKRFLIPAGLIALAVIGSQLDKDKTASANTTKSSSSATTSPTKTEDLKTPEKTKEQLKRELASFDKPFDNSTYKGSILSVQMGLVLFAAYADIIKEGKESTDEENKKLAAQLEKKVITRQIKEFPTLRKRYAEVAGEKLWESDVYVSTSGANNSVINLTGGLFASNKNIAETQKTLIDILTQFRFKEVRYRWYKGADEFTYYKLETPKDSEPVDFKQ